MLRLDEAIAHVAQLKAHQFAGQYMGGGTDMSIYNDLGRQEAKVLSLVYSAPEDSIAAELDSDIRRRLPLAIKKLGGGN